MKQISLALIFLFLAGGLLACQRRGTPRPLAADADPAAMPDLLGEYALNGVDPVGDEYGGSLLISAGEQPGEYRMDWVVTSGVLQGVGRLDGNVLRFEWQTYAAGVVTPTGGDGEYTVTANGELYGKRRVAGEDFEGQEVAYPDSK